uniref:BZIP domain-containing protein n=1 Tax=Trichuris muris TaxID=70415 RepID=A0A5S6R4K7_TRIMR
MFEELHEDLFRLDNCKLDVGYDPFWCEGRLFDELSVPNDAIGDSDDSGVSDRMANGLTFSPSSQSSEFFTERTDGQNGLCLTQSDLLSPSASAVNQYPTNFNNGVPLVENQFYHSELPNEAPAKRAAQSTVIPGTFVLLPQNAIVVSSLPTVSAAPNCGDAQERPKYVALAPNSVQTVQSCTDKPNGVAGITKGKMLKSEKQIKNRESARSFRERKKQHFVYMEWKMKELQAENNMLKRENVALKNEISRLLTRVENMQNEFLYRSQNEVVQQTKSPVKRKNTAMLAVVLMLFTVNFGPLSLPGSQVRSPPLPKMRSYTVSDQKLVRMRRSRFSEPPSFSKVFNKFETFESFPKDRVAAERPCDAGRYVNNTETLRLTDELNRWAQRHKRNWNIIMHDSPHVGTEFLHGTKNRKGASKFVKSVFDRHVSRRGPPSLQALKSGRSLMAEHLNGRNATAIDQFFSSLHWRNDTFYVVSILKDYLILPATAYNRTSRPRMSLIMPAIPYNDTLPVSFEGLAMLQIECEVMNTKLLQLSGQRNPVNSSQSNNTAKRMDVHY